MNTTPHFQQNPAGLNQVLTVVPGHIALSYAPTCPWARGAAANEGQTMLILAGQSYVLQGDFRAAYEEALASGGITACVQLYLDLKPLFGGPWSSPFDPWQMIAGAYTNALRDSQPARGRQQVRHEMALAV
jgi:hypothetical protein